MQEAAIEPDIPTGTPAPPSAPSPSSDPPSGRRWFPKFPLYVQIAIALALGVFAGLLISPDTAHKFNVPAVIILRLLGAIAPPLILVAVTRAIITANVRGRLAGKMFFLLVLNTVVAILIGLLVANVLRPGGHGSGAAPGETQHIGDEDIVSQLLANIPSSLIGPLVTNNVIGVIILSVTFGLAARRLEPPRRQKILDFLE